MSTQDTRLTHFLQKENARLRRENQALTNELRALHRYIKALQSFRDTIQHFTPEQEVLSLLDETLDCTLMLLDASDGSLMLLDEETDELVFVLVHGTVHERLPGHRIDQRQGIAGWVAENAELAIVNDVHNDWRFLPEIDECFGFTTRSLLAVPLVIRGNVLGVIEAINKRSGEDFTREDASALSILATLAASALDYATAAQG